MCVLITVIASLNATPGASARTSSKRKSAPLMSAALSMDSVDRLKSVFATALNTIFGPASLTPSRFCGNRKVDVPSCSDHTLQRVVGYYEGWAPNRPCNSFVPEQISVGVYTHLNFAFATIDPETFEVRPASRRDTAMSKRLTSLKLLDPDLKVLIALGGWTFNDPGPTATTFSDIARSETAQKAFIKSLSSMMSTYEFDGVDLDWEYPMARDRSGRDEDFDNFPKFLANLKKGLKGTGRDEITLTLPASLCGCSKHVDCGDDY